VLFQCDTETENGVALARDDGGDDKSVYKRQRDGRPVLPWLHGVGCVSGGIGTAKQGGAEDETVAGGSEESGFCREKVIGRDGIGPRDALLIIGKAIAIGIVVGTVGRPLPVDAG